jgi:competence protein ComEA
MVVGQLQELLEPTFRKQHGGFQRPEELMNVKGIGEKSFAKLKPFLAATSAPRPAAAKQ